MEVNNFEEIIIILIFLVFCAWIIYFQFMLYGIIKQINKLKRDIIDSFYKDMM